MCLSNHCCSGKAVLHIVCVCVCVCSLSYPVCNTHVPYCHLWPALLYNIFPHHLINGMIKKKITGHKMWVLIFSTTSVWDISHSKKNRVRYGQKYTLVFMWSTSYSCQNLMKLNFIDWFLKNTQISNLKTRIQWKPSCSMQTVERIEKQTWRNQSLFTILQTHLKRLWFHLNVLTTLA